MKTIFMTKAQHEAWDADLRANGHLQGEGMLETPDGKYCCLGRLQVVLDGAVECSGKGDSIGLPSLNWLKNHGIRFASREGHQTPIPFLPGLYCNAVTANDEQGYNFTQIADAIAECVQYTDEHP